MNSDGRTQTHFQKSVSPSREFDDACTKFEQALVRGELLTIEQLVPCADPRARSHLLGELLIREMEFRANRSETPSLEEFRDRFPDHVRLVKYLYFEHFMPARIGDFAIQRLLGRGSFGLVYQGWDAKLSRNVAIKVFRRNPNDPQMQGGNLLREARAAAQLRHPGVVAVYAVMPDVDGDEFLVLEYVDGKSLEDLLRSERLSPQEAADMLLAVVQALQHAHQHGLVHRDLKPANILLDQGRRPRVTDFGLALDLIAARRSPEFAGTLAYMAPEQANGETHRLDARTDLWAVGVLLYRMLSGRLPFAGAGRQELLNAIRYAEPDDLLERDPTIPPEIARIARKCLAKRMSERYQSAAELADDLSAFVTASHPRSLERAGANSSESTIVVVPKGLRCFDANDREFFLSLLPGPRDRNDVPEKVRFWENHLRELDAGQTFRVGLLYGPSGCGKSSLVRAGILPRLHKNVRSIVVEATRDETERALVREVRRQFPELAPSLTFPETLSELRNGTCLKPGEKLLLVIDQFEQWLHGWRHDVAAPLVEMLRQCDGGRIQALVLVRDDFWMPATRFFQQLDVPLVEGFNTSAVDLFDPTHAAKVLTAFGVAYGRLEGDPSRRSLDEQRFVERAVGELAVDGWIVPVRLCIFAEMVKSRPWTPSTLREVGGAQGLGTAFFEEVFDGRSASPMHRLHRKAARLVLERLLPPAGTDIRGHLVPESELQVVSGYEQRSADFAALVHCLDHELRVITPSDTEPSALAELVATGKDPSSPRLYQLTHDFLVTAIRGWLNQTRRATVRGRAQLRLAEYAEAYSARQESRQLPSWWECLSLLLLTRRRSWQSNERAMMRQAARHHVLRYGLVLLVVLILGFFIYDRMATIKAEGIVQALTTSDSHDLPEVAGLLTNQRRRVKPLLVDQLAHQPQDGDQRVRLLLGLVAVGEPRTDELLEPLLEAEPSLVVAIANVLRQYGKPDELGRRLGETTRDVQVGTERRLRAGVALGILDPRAFADEGQAIAASVVDLMLRDAAKNPGHFNTWVDALAPVQERLMAPLRQSFIDSGLSEPERLFAASVLARYAADDVPTLVELTLQSTPKQHEIIARLLKKHDAAARPALVLAATEPIPPDAAEEDKDRLARRQANAILVLGELGEENHLWPALEHRRDPRLRSFLLDHFRVVAAPDGWAQQMARENNPGIRQAMILAVAYGLGPDRPVEAPSEFVEALVRIHRDDRDSGVHSAAEWALGRIGQDPLLASARADLAKLGIRPGFGWYVTPSRITMIIIAPSGEVTLGSPQTETGRDDSDEGQWTTTIDWWFAISATEITQGQYLELCPEYEHSKNEFAPSLDCPINAVTWHEAQQFCRLLSESDDIPEAEMTLPPGDDSRKRPYANFLERTGYRLPIEAEWEVACRAGTVTPRYYGNAPELLAFYACFIDNSGGSASNVGHYWPNAYGLFDMLGNISEWCQDVYVKNPASRTALQPATPQFFLASYSLRGNEYSSTARMLRAANRRTAAANDTPSFARGFRIGQTIRRNETE